VDQLAEAEEVALAQSLCSTIATFKPPKRRVISGPRPIDATAADQQSNWRPAKSEKSRSFVHQHWQLKNTVRPEPVEGFRTKQQVVRQAHHERQDRQNSSIPHLQSFLRNIADQNINAKSSARLISSSLLQV